MCSIGTHRSGSGEALAVDGWFESNTTNYNDWVNIDPNNATQYPVGQGNIFNMSTESGYLYQGLGLRADTDRGRIPASHFAPNSGKTRPPSA